MMKVSMQNGATPSSLHGSRGSATSQIDFDNKARGSGLQISHHREPLRTAGMKRRREQLVLN